MINVSYLCDGMACEGDCSCRNHSPEPCSHTTDISHAKYGAYRTREEAEKALSDTGF